MKKPKNHVRTTTITGILSVPWEVDADDHWETFLAKSSRERCVTMANQLHFVIQLPHIDLTEKIKRKFWDHFATEKADRVRNAALYGTKEANHEGEFLSVRLALNFHNTRIEGGYRDRLEDFKNDSVGLALTFSEMIASRNVPALRRIITIIEEKGMPDGKRSGCGSGCGSELGYMLEKFAELHATTRSLPTKAQLRKACGLNRTEDKKPADKMMNKLGLKGLPTEPQI